jgi:hypothetical protein
MFDLRQLWGVGTDEPLNWVCFQQAYPIRKKREERVSFNTQPQHFQNRFNLELTFSAKTLSSKK